jgi:hypothetical protein
VASKEAIQTWSGPRRWAVLFLTLFLFYWSVRTGRQASQSLDHDFGVYYRAGQAILQGGDPYGLEHGPLLTFKYAPVMAMMMAPWGMLDPVVARILWCVVDFAAVIAVIVLSMDLAGVPKQRRGSMGFMIGLLVLGHVIAELHAGQTTSLWMMFLLLAVRGMTRSSATRRDVIGSGFCLALSVCFKLVPLAIVPYYFITPRPWRGMASFSLSVVFLLLVPALFLGWERSTELLLQWPTHLLDTTNLHQVTRVQNQSVLAQISRITDVGKPQGATIEQAKLVWFALASIAGLGVYGWIVRRRSAPPIVHLSLLLLFVTAFNPLAWRYNFLALTPAYAYIIEGLYRSEDRWLERFAGAILASLIMTVHFPDYVYASGGRLWAMGLLTVIVWMTWQSSQNEWARRRRSLAVRGTAASRANSSREDEPLDHAVDSAR